MEAIPEFTYQIENKPEPKEIGTIIIHTTFVRPVDMDLNPILTRSRSSCSLPAKEFIEDEDSPRKQELYYFLTESGVDEYDAIKLMLKLIRLALEVTSSVEYCPRYALSMWLTLYVVPSSQGSVLHDSQYEEAIQASHDDYERNIGFIPASKLEVACLDRRIYKRKPKTSLISNRKTKRKTTRSIAEKCTVCCEEFKTGRELVTLPCGHEFDNKCIEDWFKVGHVCPLCRFELPCEEDDDSFQIITTVF